MISRIVNKVKRILLRPVLKEGNLIIHIGQHKSMTSFFNSVFYSICIAFNWNFKKYFSQAEFEADWSEISKIHFKKTTIICCYNFYPNLEWLQSFKYKGTNIIRDPRDLLVSGYQYHLWTKETWANQPMNEELIDRLNADQTIPAAQFEDFKKLSYRDLLNQVDECTGYQLELNLRGKHFKLMDDWNYSNPNFLELKYENVFKNEITTFKSIFDFYGFHDEMKKEGLKIVQLYTFESLQKKGKAGNKKHAATGISGRWKDQLPEVVVNKFNERFGDLIEKTNYSI